MIRHLLSHDSLTKSVIEGDVGSQIGRGRLRTEYMKQNTIDVGKNCYKELNELSNDKKAWRTVAIQSNKQLKTPWILIK